MNKKNTLSEMTSGLALFFFSKPRPGPSATNQSAGSSELTCLPVFGLRSALHLMVDGHHCDGVLGVRVQVLQDGGGGGSRHLVLVKEKRKNFQLGEL